MKRIGLMFLLGSMPIFFCFAQGVNTITEAKSGEKYYYVGSLKPEGKLHTDKLKIEVFGGSFHESSIGVQTFTIADRDRLKINSEIRNGKSNYYELRVYKATNNDLDFVIKSSPNYTTLWIQAWLSNAPISALGKPQKMIPIDIVEYNSIARGTVDITDNYSINYIMTSNEYGSIGIGTDAPQAKLDVRGKVIADEVEIKVNKGADFVFKPDYNLKPLSEVEAFVRENQHLPEVPSEKEMQQNGLNVNDMQIKLLQKIEELTLYVIQQDKKIIEQSEKIAELEKKIEK